MLERDLQDILNRGVEGILRRAAGAIEALCVDLRELRHIAGEEWHRRFAPMCLAHPLQRLLCEDPYTARAFAKPRGYAGDAVMLDYVYGQHPPAETSELGRWIFAQTTGSSSGASVRERRRLLAAKIDRLARERPGARVLSIGAGHLRETQSCEALRAGTLDQIIAVDQDAESLAVVQAEQGMLRVETRQLSIRRLATSPQSEFADFDLVYSAGVFDYLPDVLASKLIAAMFAMLREGGSLLVGNFVPSSHGAGYMEAFMDWKLVCRDEQMLLQLTAAAGLPPSPRARTFMDAERNVAYLEISQGSRGASAA